MNCAEFQRSNSDRCLEGGTSVNPATYMQSRTDFESSAVADLIDR
jgi:hypothetical protein